MTGKFSTRPTIKQQQSLYDQLDQAMILTTEAIISLSDKVSKMTNASDQQHGYAMLDEFNEAKRQLNLELYSVEEWLIEHEAPGWVST